jgi:serine/threonine protein kinase
LRNRFDEDIWTLKKLAEGRDYDLYIAFWPEENEKVLIKHIRPGPSEENKIKIEERLLKEAATLEEFWSPYFPKIFDIRRRVVDDSLYIISEYFPGVTVKQFLETATPQELSAELYQKLDKDLHFALDYLHNKKGVLHLDLTPDNIIIDLDKNFHVIDFENSNLIGKELTREEIRGKEGYLHPDFLEKKSIKLETTHDHYSLLKTLEDFYAHLPFLERAKLLRKKVSLKQMSMGPAMVIASFALFFSVQEKVSPAREVIKPRVSRSPAIPKSTPPSPYLIKDQIKRKSSSLKKEIKVYSKVKAKKLRPTRKKVKRFEEDFIERVGTKDQELKECLHLFHKSLPSKIKLEFSVQSPQNKLNSVSILEPQGTTQETKICLSSIYKGIKFPAHKSKKSYTIVQSFQF